MSVCVHLHVCIPCSNHAEIAKIAGEHFARQASKDEDPNWAVREETRWFLKTISAGSGFNAGPKGGLLLWGTVGNHTNPAEFVNHLKPFWEEILSDHGEDYRGPMESERILVFYEREQTEAASAYEIFWSDPDSVDRQLVIRHHERLPFTWMQM
jgi:hypothetical protein